MTEYENHMEVGLYREEVDVVAGTNIVLSYAIATNCHPLLRNKPLGIGYVLGIEDIEVTIGAHAGAHLNANVVSASGANEKIIVLDANTWDTETVVVRYYASGYGVGAANSTISSVSDKVRAEHPDNILSAYNRKGHVNPLEAGMVFDNAMGRVYPSVTAGEATVLEYDISDGSSTGTWSFSGNRPYYATCVRFEAKESDMDTTKGVKIHVYEDGNEVVEQAGNPGVVINDTDNWLTSEYADGAETWYSANIYLGMMLCSDLKITIETNGGNGDISLSHIFVMGWYVPDSLTTSEVTESFTYHAVPAPCGLYTEKVYTVNPNIGIIPEPRCLHDMDASLRTKPHPRGGYRYGIEYAKNLTTDEFITESIRKVGITIVYFDPSAATAGDIVELGYYSYDTLGVVAGLTPKVGDTIRSTDVDGLVRAIDRMDRIDFLDSNSPYAGGTYTWSPEMFAEYDTGAGYFGPSTEISSKWYTILSFDPYNYNARKVDVMHTDYLDRGTSGIDESPFFVNGFYFACDENSVTGGNKYANGLKFKITFHSGTDSVRQRNESELTYYPVASTNGMGIGEPVPGAMGIEDSTPTGGAGAALYIPLGLLRCYSFKVDVAVLPGEAFTTIHKRIAQLHGWMPEA